MSNVIQRFHGNQLGPGPDELGEGRQDADLNGGGMQEEREG